MNSEQAHGKFQKELNAGTISLVLLALIQRNDAPMYGYQIAKELERIGGGELPMNQGAFYPVLRSLEKQGLLAGKTEPSDSGPPRKYYRLTNFGRRALLRWREIWTQSKTFVDEVLGEAHGESNPSEPSRRVSRESRARDQAKMRGRT